MQATSNAPSCLTITPVVRLPKPGRFAVLAWLVGVWALVLPAIAAALQPPLRQRFDLPAAPAEISLRRMSVQSGRQILFATRLTAGVETKVVRGEFSVMEAVSIMLTGTGLEVVQDDTSGVLTVRRLPPPMTTDLRTKIRQVLQGALLAVLIPNPLAAQAGTPKTEKKVEPAPIELSPFLVSQQKSQGYAEEQSLAGSRTAKKLIDIPGSVVILNREVLDDLSATTVAKALNFGVSGVSQATGYFDAVTIRGFGNAFSLRNGVTKTTFKTSPMYDVERVEVIKGPTALLLGVNTFLGGAVNLISRRASASPTGDIQAAFSENNYIRLAADVSGPLSKSEGLTLNYRMTLGGLSADRDKEIQNEEEKFIGGALDMYFGNNTSVLVNWYVFQNDGYRYWDDFLDNSTGLAYPGAAGGKGALKWGQLNKYSTRSFSPGRGKDVLWKNNDSFLDVTFLTKLTENGNLRAYFALTSLRDVRRIMRGISLQADNYTLNRQFLPFNYDLVDHNFQVDYLHALKLTNVKFSTTVGTDGYKTDYRQALGVFTPAPLDTRQAGFPNDDAFFATNAAALNGPNLAADNVQKPTQFSYYAQEDISFLQDRVILVGGLRWIVPGGTNKNMLTGAITDRPDKTLRVHKYGVVVKLLPSISVYYADALNVRQQVGFVDLNRGGDQLVPQKDAEGILKEFGVKFNHSLSANISLYGSVAHYDMAQTNIRINTQFPDGSFGQVQNARDEAKGWEFDYGMRNTFAEGRSDLIFTYSNGKSAIASDKTLQTDNFVPVKVSFIAKYTWTGGPLNGLMVGGAMMDQSNSRLGGYAINSPRIISLFGRYSWHRHWETQLNVDNLTNERYITGFITQGLIEGSEPRRIRVDLKYRW